MLVTFVRSGIGGIATIWKAIEADDERVKVLWYKPDHSNFIDKEQVFHFDIFAPKVATFKRLSQYLDELGVLPSVYIANEEFDLEFLNWLKPVQPLAYIAHVNGDHSYKAAIQFKGIIDAFYTVAAPAANFLHCRGLSPVVQISYSITLPRLQAFTKENLVIYLGRFACDKNIEETASHLNYFQSRGYRALWIGNGPEEHTIRNLSTCEIITDISRDELYLLLARAKFLILNSYYEGLPVVLFECIHFQILPILSYVDTSCDEILCGSYLLASRDPEETFNRAVSCLDVPHRSHPRINNPALNRELVNSFLNLSKTRPSKILRHSSSLLDRVHVQPLSSLITIFRKYRWEAQQKRI